MTAQTATTPTETALIRPYPIDQVWRKGGYYVARLTGPDDRYGVARDFLKGKPVKTRRTVEYGPGDLGDLPAWILRRPDDQCGSCGQTRPTRTTGEDVIAAYASGWINHGRIFGAEDLLRIHDAGPPGTPGSWTGTRCDNCEVTPILKDDAPLCPACVDTADTRGHLAALPDAEVF